MKWLDKLLGIERLDLGVPCEWEDIEVGEVFRFTGCCCIGAKTSKNSVMVLDTTGPKLVDFIGGTYSKKDVICEEELYKLPKETQELYLP